MERVLRLHIQGCLDLTIPDGVEEDDEGWDEWRESALLAALDDGRWTESTYVEESEVGVVDEQGWIQRT